MSPEVLFERVTPTEEAVDVFPTDLQDQLEELYANYVPEIRPPTGEKLDVVVNKERVDEVLGTLLEAYDTQTFPYNLDSVRVPHDVRHMPQTLERGGVDHAMFLWTVCYYMRGGVKSNEAVKRLSMMYDQRPELFDCQTAAETAPHEVAKLLKDVGLGFQERVGNQWVENAKRMRDMWDGDPRNIFKGINKYEYAAALIKNDQKGGGFIGFQEKMVSMAIYYLADDGLIEPFTFPIPIDLHVMRVSIANELITFPNAPQGTNLCTEETLSTLRQLYYDFAVENNVNPQRLCNAVWLLSEALCGQHPGNVTLEPLGRKNRNGRSTVLIPVNVDPEDKKQQATYEATCRNCPVQETCQYNIPGKLYYVAGSVIIRGKRLVFPMPKSFQDPLFKK